MQEIEERVEQYHDCMKKSGFYYAYHFIGQYCDSIFTDLHSDMLFNVSLYLLNTLKGEIINGVSRVKILCTLAEKATIVGAFEVARYAFRNLQDLKIPTNWEEKIDLNSMLIKVNVKNYFRNNFFFSNLP